MREKSSSISNLHTHTCNAFKKASQDCKLPLVQRMASLLLEISKPFAYIKSFKGEQVGRASLCWYWPWRHKSISSSFSFWLVPPWPVTMFQRVKISQCDFSITNSMLLQWYARIPLYFCQLWPVYTRNISYHIVS